MDENPSIQEIERQVCEAPDICVIAKKDERGNRWISEFTDEDGTVIAKPCDDQFDELYRRYSEEIDAVLDDF